MKSKTKKGFTIIELLAAIVIVGIIVSLAIIVIDKYILQGHDTVDEQLSKQLSLSAEAYIDDNRVKLANQGDGSVIWYTTLKAGNYVTNSLTDSKGNSCAKSYVTVKKDGSKYSYTSCIICDNDGYNNTNGQKECIESFDNNIKCEWEDIGKVVLGTKSKNTVTLKLTCSGKDLKIVRGSNFDTSDSFNVTGGNITIGAADIVKKSKTFITTEVKYKTKSDAHGKGAVIFKEGEVYAKDRKNNNIYNVDTIYDKITIDGKGPSCTLSGPYKDMNLKTAVKAVASGSSVYYGLTCKDDNNINGSIEKTGFNSSSSISSIDIVSRPKNNNTEKSAVIKVTVVKGNDSKLTLKYKKDELKDDLDNGNESVSSKIDGKETTLVIDDQAPTCSFNGPAADFDFVNRKKLLDITNDTSNEFVYYELKCTDENGINKASFKYTDIQNNGFSRIEQSGKLLEVKNSLGDSIGYRYVIKAYETNVANQEAYLSYDASNMKDSVGNSGSGKINSDKVKMVDGNKIPTCNINVTYQNGYALLTGTMNDDVGLAGYAWSESYGDPSNYTSISGTSYTASEKAYSNNVYYLHVKNTNGLEGYCVSDYILMPTPETPILTASDGKESGEWHNSNYTLTASSSESNVTYYYGNSEDDVTSTSRPSVSSETEGDWYYAKACWSNNDNLCSGVAKYKALLDKTPPKCDIKMNKYKGYSSNPTWSEKYENNHWTQYNVRVEIEGNCSDSGGSGLDGTPYMTKNGSGKYVKYATITDDEGDGIHTIKAYAYDKAGNSYTKERTIKRDTVAPTLSLSLKPLVAGQKIKVGDTVKVTCKDSTSGISGITADEFAAKSDEREETLKNASGGTGDKTMTRTVTFKTKGARYLRAGCVDGALNGVWTGDEYNLDAYYSVSKRTYTKTVSTLEYFWSEITKGSGTCNPGVNCCSTSSGRVCSSTTHNDHYYTGCSEKTEKQYEYAWENYENGNSGEKVSEGSGEWCKNNGYLADFAGCSASGNDCTASYVGDTCRRSSKKNGYVYCSLYRCTKSYVGTVGTGDYKYSDKYECLKRSKPDKTYEGEDSCKDGETSKSNGENGTLVITTTCKEED